MDDTLVFIDAGFLSKLSSYFGEGEYFKIDLVKFSRNLAKKEGLFLKHIFYATAPPFQGTPPSDDEKRRKEGYDKFKGFFDNRKDFTFLEGRVQKLDLGDRIKYSQKAVDTVLTMALGATLVDFPGVRKIILVSSDTDFCPVVEMLRFKGVEVLLYSYYERRRNTRFSRSHHLIDSCSRYTKLTKEDFLKSLIKNEK